MIRHQQNLEHLLEGLTTLESDWREVKAYGATGSKQTDVIGDVTRILEEKRGDTPFLLVTDGITWKSRVNDLRKLVALQNKGEIYRIYTKSMVSDLRADLSQMKSEKGL